jgi:hypothetical protein
MVPPDALVRHPNVFCLGRALQAARQYIRPAIISVCGGAVSIGDGIAKYHNGCRALRRLYVNF